MEVQKKVTQSNAPLTDSLHEAVSKTINNEAEQVKRINKWNM